MIDIGCFLHPRRLDYEAVRLISEISTEKFSHKSQGYR
jgi:hypothetical protein